jgi:uncharacterized repeat protein (TIGR03803 family)
MGRLSWAVRTCGICLLYATMAGPLPAQTFATLYNFCSQGGSECADGDAPYAGLVQGADGNLYGTTVAGGRNGSHGVIFRITTDGTLTTLHKFNATDGARPYGTLIQGSNGKFYGTTFEGGSGSCQLGCGTVFSITASGKLTVLHNFNGTDGVEPYAGVVQGANGRFYGTTYGGGADGEGSVFSMASDGKLKTLVRFGFTDGYQPFGDMVQATNGKFYGTTFGGGANGDSGTIFSITGSATLKTVFSFNGRNGNEPSAGLIQATDGNFYGTTYEGGKTCRGHNNICGTIFEITPGGKLTTLYSFCAGGSPRLDGSGRSGALVEGTDGNFYGTTSYGGQNNVCTTQHPGCGTIFKITPDGTLTTLYNFSGSDGANPIGALIQDTNGTFYGTSLIGGTYNSGTIFSLSLGLGPFIETRPTSGTVETAVTILGTDLTGVTNVRFNGLESKFTIVSTSEITTTVPKGATTGPVRVITPTGKLQSNVPFRVN